MSCPAEVGQQESLCTGTYFVRFYVCGSMYRYMLALDSSCLMLTGSSIYALQ
jgi:hypothetical protein